MKTNILKTSTAMIAALSLAAPGPLLAQSAFDTLLDGRASPEQRPICADGSVPVCADGMDPLSMGEMFDRGSEGGDLAGTIESLFGTSPTGAIAVCMDGSAALCAPGVDVLMPGTPAYDAAVEGTEVAPETEAMLDLEGTPAIEEPLPEGQAALDQDGEVEAAPLPELTEEAPDALDEPTPEVADVAPEALEPPEDPATDVTDAIPDEADAIDDVAEAEPAELPAEADLAETTPPEAAESDEALADAIARSLAEQEAGATDETVADAEVDAEAELEAAPDVAEVPAEDPAEAELAEVPADDPAEAEVAEVPADDPAETDVAETDVAPEVAADADVAAAGAEAGAEAAAAAAAGLITLPGGLTLTQDQAGEVERIVGMLTGSGTAAEGEGVTGLGALAGSDAEASETVEVEVTAEETRQSDEDFGTDPAGRQGTAEAAAAATRERSGLSNFERFALLGLGALAVGAIMSNGDEVVANTGDRVVVRRADDQYYVLKDDDVLLRQPGSNVRTERYNDGSTRTIVTREDGSIIITVRDASGRVILREREIEGGQRIVLIDDTETYAPVEVTTLPPPTFREVTIGDTSVAEIRTALERASARNINRYFSLRQIREIEQVRKLVPEIAVRPINFDTASAAIRPTEAQTLTELGRLMTLLIQDNPREVFLIEGHTDAVGSAAYNLALSDRRAESLALALTEYFNVPPENMVVQGYGESDLRIQTEAAERENRRVTVRRITPLLTDRVAQN